MYKKIVEEAFKAMKNAYAPYSKYHVGACVETKDGRYIWGANIENASYGATNCAERSAMFSAYSNCAERTAIFETYALGYRKDDIVAIAIVSDGDRLAAPCGACRQVLSELLKGDTPIVLSNGKDYMETNINELLPMQFTSEDVDR